MALIELYHYGVKGMKWGVRHDKDRKARRTTKREARASKYDKKAEEIQKQIDSLDRNSRSYSHKKKVLEKQKVKYEKIAQIKRDGKLTTGQKAALIGGALVLAYSAYKIADSGEFDSVITKGKAFVNKTGLFKKNNVLASRNLNGQQIRDLVVSRINPDFGEFGTTNNCRRCTLAYEMSRRGFDVKATKTFHATGQNDLGLTAVVDPSSGYKLGPFSSITNVGRMGKRAASLIKEASSSGTEIDMREGKKIFGIPVEQVMNSVDFDKQDVFQTISSKIMSENPDHARGEISITYKGTTAGHSIAWEIVNGAFTMFDCQAGKVIDSNDLLKEFYPSMGSVQYIRLDDKDLDLDALTKWVKNL